MHRGLRRSANIDLAEANHLECGDASHRFHFARAMPWPAASLPAVKAATRVAALQTMHRD
jgi:hypothetical protein